MSDDTSVSGGDDDSVGGASSSDAGGDAASTQDSNSKPKYRPLRIWPAVLILALMLLTRSLPSLLENPPENIWMSAAFGPLLGGLLILIWWVLLSRSTWRERVGGFLGILLVAGGVIATIDPTMRGPAVMVLTIPLGMGAFALGAILFGRVLSSRRTVIALLMAVLGFGYSLLLRSDGMWGDFKLGLHWRWVPSPEDVMLANMRSRSDVQSELFPAEQVQTWLENPEWPGFRGEDRTGRQQGIVFASDWDSNPPKEIWRAPVGPGWSSYAVAGKQLFTQEQRGEQECIVCYDADSGREVWSQSIESRFDDPLGGPGPRATPTLGAGGLFAMGAQGWLTRLDPRSGEIVWKLDLREVADRTPPMWGFSSSPLVIDDVVVVYAGGKDDKGTLAFDVGTGDLRWSSASGDHSYSSPQSVQIGDKEYILMLTNLGIDVLDPADGSAVLRYDWKINGYRSVQPQLVNGDSLLLPTGAGTGTRMVSLTTDGEWSADEVWESLSLKPDFNDFVIYEGHLYGFDDAIFTCVDLSNGERCWKRGRYGKGQVLLLQDSGLLLVAGERGQLVLLKADPEEHEELAEIQAMEGRTWNHPVVVGDRLYLRNSQESVCYQLPVANSSE
ncbi:MAG: PQQ-binding-like beta-propeller repeat protein [Rubripirellula sp.]